MARYRRIATIEAVQFVEGRPIPEGVERDEAGFFIHTLEGKMRTEYGCWIATGDVGERWSIKPHIFAVTYVPLED